LNPPAHYRRAIALLGEHWLVLDDLQSLAAHQYRLHWLLMDAPFKWDEESGTMTLDTPSGSYYLQTMVLNGNGDYSIVRADETNAQGWRAPYYQTREPAISLALATQASVARFVSLFGPTPCLLKANRSSLQVQGESWLADVNLQSDKTTPSGKDHQPKPLITSLSVSGSVEDRLEIS
jgi:hypothetical protein